MNVTFPRDFNKTQNVDCPPVKALMFAEARWAPKPLVYLKAVTSKATMVTAQGAIRAENKAVEELAESRHLERRPCESPRHAA